MNRTRSIVGPEAMRVERDGISSQTVGLTVQDGPAEIHAKAAVLWETIRPFVSWMVWTQYRLRVARQRRQTAQISAAWPGPYFPGPDLT